MARRPPALALVVATLCALAPAALPAQDALPLAGRWRLNREQSQFPRTVGFDADWFSAAGAPGSPGSGGGAPGGPPTGGRTSYPVSRVNREDAMKISLLTDEVREPTPTLTIAEADTSVTITPEGGAARTFTTSGRDALLELGDVTLTAVATREAGRLVVRYRIDPAREVRYTYARTASPEQLVVDVQFLDRGKGETVRRVYEPDRGAPTAAAAPRGPAQPPLRPPAAPAAAPAAPAGGQVPASGTRAAGTDFDQRPGAQFRGLTTLGIVVEGLGPQAATCGLRADAIQSLAAKTLTGAGLTVSPNTSEDTYLYVNVQTATMAGGLCLSRYDALLYTHTTAPLEYHATPVLVDVVLLRKGGLAAGSAASHAQSLMQGLQDYVGQFATTIRDANR